MPKIDSLIMKEKGVRRHLKVQLDEGESLMKAIPQAMQQHGIKEAKVEEINGSVKELLINFFEGSRFDSKRLKDQKIMRAHGTVRQSFGELFGSVNVAISLKPPVSGTLVNAIAGKDTEIVMSFIEFVPAQQ